jgi:RimJ/RimL family protein N-acetyltransferase
MRGFEALGSPAPGNARRGRRNRIDSSGKLPDVGDFRGIDLDDLVLTTERLILRPWAPGDAAEVATIMQNPDMHRFLALPRPYTAQDAAQYVTDIAVRPRAEGTGLECAVVERAGGRLVGSAALRLGREPDIGYWVAPGARGAGYAAEATSALAEWAFSAGLRRVGLLCDARNVASARTALSAGFRFEGVAHDAYIGGGFGPVPELRGDVARFARLAGDPPGRVRYAFPPLDERGLADDVLCLRPVGEQDAAALAETEDELTVRWNFFGAPRPAEQLARVARRARLDWLVGTVAFFAMVDLETGRLAGSLQLRQAGPPQVGGIGYVVHPQFRGRRYTTRALRLLAPWAFEVADFARLELGAKIGNEASLRAAAGAGFEPDGVRRSRMRNADGSFSDEARYALINPKYA